VHLNQPILPRSLVDQAFERIAEAIVIGEIAPGERILEALLARQLGISRGVLREAMQRLEGLKLVTRTSNIGVRVIGLSETGLSELYTMREALEGMAARLAATHMEASEIRALQVLLERHGQSKDLRQGDGYYQALADQDFHALIARGSGNSRLEHTLCNELYFQLRLYRYRTSAPPGRARAAFAEHQAVVKAISARDPDRAEAAMRVHLSNSLANLKWSGEALVVAPDSAAPDKKPVKKPAAAKILRAG
jgi:DNA-binding GntR family transcriptional regulator